jgi:very-short-patch-repair endonuclease
MDRKVTRRRASAMIVAIAQRQHGVLSVPQALAAGVSWEELRSREAAGWLTRLHRGVYSIAGRQLTQRGYWAAAVLACGARAVLSHADAAALWRIRPLRERVTARAIHVTVPRTERHRHTGIVAHRPLRLDPGELAVVDRIPVTAAARTILDLATVVERRPLERAIDEAERLRLCSPEELGAVAREHRRRAGTALLAAVLERHAVATTRTRSELEERFLALCRERGLPQPLVNAPLLGLTVDFFWPPAVVVEVDGAGGHLTRKAFQDDRDRDSLLAAHGYSVLRFTWWDVERRPGVVADRVREVLRRAG